MISCMAAYHRIAFLYMETTKNASGGAVGFFRVSGAAADQQNRSFLGFARRLRISKVYSGEIRLQPTAKGEKRPSQFRKIQRRSKNKIITAFQKGIDLLHFVFNYTACLDFAAAAIGTGRNFRSIGRNLFHASVKMRS